MALILEDCVVETATTTGAGDFTLAGAVTGFKAFSSVCATSDTFYYLIEAIDGSGDRTGAWESGLGTYSAANTLTRTTVHNSSNADAIVTFAAGTKRVMLAKTSTSFNFRGASVRKAANQTGQNFTTATAVTWDTEDYDTDAFHDTGANTSRMTIPTGLTYIKLLAGVRLANVTASLSVLLSIRKNGTTIVAEAASTSSFTTPALEVATAVIAAVSTDYFEVMITVVTDTSVDIVAVGSFFALEVIQ